MRITRIGKSEVTETIGKIRQQIRMLRNADWRKFDEQTHADQAFRDEILVPLGKTRNPGERIKLIVEKQISNTPDQTDSARGVVWD